MCLNFLQHVGHTRQSLVCLLEAQHVIKTVCDNKMRFKHLLQIMSKHYKGSQPEQAEMTQSEVCSGLYDAGYTMQASSDGKVAPS